MTSSHRKGSRNSDSSNSNSLWIKSRRGRPSSLEICQWIYWRSWTWKLSSKWSRRISQRLEVKRDSLSLILNMVLDSRAMLFRQMSRIYWSFLCACRIRLVIRWFWMRIISLWKQFSRTILVESIFKCLYTDKIKKP